MPRLENSEQLRKLTKTDGLVKWDDDGHGRLHRFIQVIISLQFTPRFASLARHTGARCCRLFTFISLGQFQRQAEIPV
jgi:hypothetical protein